MKATQKKTTLRYQQVKEVIDDLKLCMSNPEDVLIYTMEQAPEETIMMSQNEMKHIWSKNEVLEYSGKKDPLDRVVTIAGVILALTIVGIVAALIFNGFAKEMIPVNATIPELSGIELTQAIKSVEEAMLKLDVVGEEYNDVYEKGYIISQDPLAGTVVLQDETISVVVSKGIEISRVINVSGLEYAQAETNLKEEGFEVAVTPEFSDTVAIGVVIDQEPSPNQDVEKGSLVTVFVSKGPEEILIEVPNLKGLSLLEATSVVDKLKLKIGNVSYINHDSVAVDSIISMTVEPGKEVKEGYIIDVAVSLGPEIITASKSFVINNILSHDQTSCKLSVVLKLNGEEKTLFNETVDASVFPLTLTATETGQGTIHVYNDDIQEYEFFVQFTDEGEQ
jgi:serine/threonine-protein kinase